MTTFTDLGIDTDLVTALAKQNITTAFPVQAQTIPLALAGNDIIGQAKTGTGKTYSFGLPLLQALGTAPAKNVAALIVVPTRELAVQVCQDLNALVTDRNVQVTAIYGGKSAADQAASLAAGAQVVVGTPGRLLDLANQQILQLDKVQHLVLDEADEMLDLGFIQSIEKLFKLLPGKRQTLLFSATMPASILTLAREFMHKPIHIRVTDPAETTAQNNIEHFVYRVHNLDRDEMLARILQATGRGRTVIFTRTKRQAATLYTELKTRGFTVATMHGDLDQSQREKALKRFKRETSCALIATDVAARGIDVEDVTHVINYAMPDDDKTYLHRAGRTGRAGKTGIAVTFVGWDELHKWSILNTALELGVAEPQETYSASAHLYAELNIPTTAKGKLVQPKTQKQPAASAEQAGTRKVLDAQTAAAKRTRRARTRTRS